MTSSLCEVFQTRSEEGDLSSFQVLNNDTQITRNGNENDQVYVHPLAKHSPLKLSDKSLEMCTEILGSETGSEVLESWNSDASFCASEGENFYPKARLKHRETYFATKRLNHSRSFPPPLTSMEGSEGVKVKPRREGGRLILQAVTVSCHDARLQAERDSGRLRLSLLNPCFLDSDDQEEEEEEEKEIEEKCLSDGEEEKEEELISWEGNSENGGGGIGTRKFQRASRRGCKEGDRTQGRDNGLLAWEPFWVAT